MPIYAYKCGSCGHQKDVLQKISDAPLTACPACGVESFSKQLTAAGFQLKGSGWYATDFKGTPPAASADKAADKTEAKSAEKPADGAVPAAAPAAADSKAAASSAPAPAPTPAAAAPAA